jgi:hypothetical protein
VVLSGIVAALVPTAAWLSGSWLSGVILLLGCLGVLVVNVLTAKRR